MIVLALDTSTDISSIALLRDDTPLAMRSISARMNHCAQLFPCVDELLASCGVNLRDVNLCAVGVGPGSFSGIRVSIAAAKGWRLATQLPLVGVSSVDAIAEEALSRIPMSCCQIAVVLDARRDELYFAAYKPDAGTLGNATHTAVVAPEKLPSLILQPTFLVGPDNERLAEKILHLMRKAEPDETGLSRGFDKPEPTGCHVAGTQLFVERKSVYPNAAVTGKLGLRTFIAQGGGDAQLEPVYLRPAVTP